MERLEKPPWDNFLLKAAPRWMPTLKVVAASAATESTPVDLVAIKNSIAETDTNIWEYAKKISNPYELIYTYKDSHIPGSLSVVKPLSRSYFKMIEMLQLTNYLAEHKQGPGLRTAHVCEGPGGFIEAIYDLAPKIGRAVRSTHAITLRSTKSHIPGWRRAQHFMNRHREIRIEYGPDNTGNILHKENRNSFIATAGRANHIFTADGGFDFTNNYSAQETSIFTLLLASIHVGFSVLGADGLFILKVFDCFSRTSQQLVAFMAAHFNKWTLYKPATSRPCNSEHYFIGVGFRGARPENLATLETLIEAPIFPEHLFDEEVPPAIADPIREQVEFMHSNQLRFLQLAIGRATDWKNKPPKAETLYQLWSQSQACAFDFMRRFSVIYHYPLPPINCQLSLPSGEIAGLGEDCEVDSVPRDEFRQSLTPGDAKDCQPTSDPA